MWECTRRGHSPRSYGTARLFTIASPTWGRVNEGQGQSGGHLDQSRGQIEVLSQTYHDGDRVSQHEVQRSPIRRNRVGYQPTSGGSESQPGQAHSEGQIEGHQQSVTISFVPSQCRQDRAAKSSI